jgi:hypothetical protein
VESLPLLDLIRRALLAVAAPALLYGVVVAAFLRGATALRRARAELVLVGGHFGCVLGVAVVFAALAPGSYLQAVIRIVMKILGTPVMQLAVAPLMAFPVWSVLTSPAAVDVRARHPRAKLDGTRRGATKRSRRRHVSKQRPADQFGDRRETTPGYAAAPSLERAARGTTAEVVTASDRRDEPGRSEGGPAASATISETIRISIARIEPQLPAAAVSCGLEQVAEQLRAPYELPVPATAVMPQLPGEVVTAEAFTADADTAAVVTPPAPVPPASGASVRDGAAALIEMMRTAVADRPLATAFRGEVYSTASGTVVALTPPSRSNAALGAVGDRLAALLKRQTPLGRLVQITIRGHVGAAVVTALNDASSGAALIAVGIDERGDLALTELRCRRVAAADAVVRSSGEESRTTSAPSFLVDRVVESAAANEPAVHVIAPPRVEARAVADIARAVYGGAEGALTRPGGEQGDLQELIVHFVGGDFLAIRVVGRHTAPDNLLAVLAPAGACRGQVARATARVAGRLQGGRGR